MDNGSGSTIFPGLGSTLIAAVPEWFGWMHNLSLPLLVMFVLPWMYVLLILSSIPYLHLCNIVRLQFWRNSNENEFWNKARWLMAYVWNLHSRIFHGYEVTGLENLPETGPALLIYYHGALPIDMYYLTADTMLKRNRLIHTVGDRFLDHIPGWRLVSRVMKVTSGSVQSCVSTLRAGELLSIAPGGVYEAQFGDNMYEVLWKNRTGFARVALEAKVPIIPMFTVNIRECFRTVSLARWLFVRIYNVLKIPVLPIYGGFPVKLRTVLGKPIPYDGSLSPADLQEKVAGAIAELVQEHQRRPGEILQAIGDRFEAVHLQRKET
ncbi:transmembrane protein 68-like [Anopheles funestus]|uniref:transmembrane protein 68-like n=1 Tax=Anopheles funestus TaxID=62324 RepID=UPI0020C6210E|nr:transmembrane protein 68-like [Anopheles funestus]XP_049278542.1 transmembrane protein 68-like [Anopheles funestus]XP_049278543.1 transmembrane protein 68-like [Anopheles funestus]XP_049278544.1 transmembrane protein 68-like [Anopheles funestus]XP_049278546.1 transmembrane protein 68-like [Anopheles funestus]